MTQPVDADPFSQRESVENLPSEASSSSALPSTPPTTAGLSASQSFLSESLAAAANLIVPETRTPSQIRSLSRSRSSNGSLGRTTPIDAGRDGHRQLICRSFAPRIAVFASPDTEEFVRGKGLDGGFCSLIRPFGENVPGKVIIRDSVGGSKGWDGFGVRFVPSQTLQQAPSAAASIWDSARNNSSQYLSSPRVSSDPSSTIESCVKNDLHNSLEASSQADMTGVARDADDRSDSSSQASLYQNYLCKVLSSSPLTPYESFSHPVACMICVSSHNPAPIDTLRHLYAQTNPGSGKIPAWMSTEYLRYYVLLHDDENDDITKSTALFDLMKRHFGLHCHLLRLKSSQPVVTNEDTIRIPAVKWLSAEEEMALERMKDYTEDAAVSEGFLSESDAGALNSFLREMITQSIIPFMESRVVTWNDQVASRRRGISGRFVSLSKRFAGFGGSKTSSSSTGSPSTSNSNYNAQEGCYPPYSPEATMRQLADFAFMLRDWKLAYTTYDLLRSDFSHDKAWQYHAATNEMAAITSLMNAQTFGMRYRADLVEQMLDSAFYSYLTRCSLPWGVIRCLTISIELLISQGPSCADDCRRWGGRLLEGDVLRPFAQALTTARIADCYVARMESTVLAQGARKRQAAFWNLLASKSWARLEQKSLAQNRLREANSMYQPLLEEGHVPVRFKGMADLWNNLAFDRQIAGAENSAEDLIDTSIQQVHSEAELSRGRSLSAAFPRNTERYDDEGFTSQDASGL